MTISRKLNNIDFKYTISGGTLSRSSEFSGLGLTFDSKLSFTNHMSNITAHAFKLLGFIIRNTVNWGYFDHISLNFFG